jgi:hypothetical protein
LQRNSDPTKIGSKQFSMVRDARQSGLGTGSFMTYQNAFTQAQLNAGQNTITLFNVTDHGISRVDLMRVTPAPSALPTDPNEPDGRRGQRPGRAFERSGGGDVAGRL